MTLEEAWYKLLEFDNYDNLTPSQVYSIISDYGVFTSFPKLRIAIKTALQYGLWEQVYSQSNAVSIAQLRSKLENDGFADKIIDEIIASFYSECPKAELNQSNVSPELNKSQDSKEALPTTDNGMNFKYPFGLVKCSKLGLESNIQNQSNVLQSLNAKLCIAPELNNDFNVIFNELYFSESKGDNRLPYSSSVQSGNYSKYRLTFNITTTPDRVIPYGLFYEVVRFSLFITDIQGRIHSKEYVTSLNLNDKYAIAVGDYDVTLDMPVSEIYNVALVPETGDLNINCSRPANSTQYLTNNRYFNDFSPLICDVEVEDKKSSLSNCEIEFSDFQFWGFGKSISLSFYIKGSTRFCSGYCLGNHYVLAFFNEKGVLIDTQNLFIGKTGYVGPRGGLHETTMCAGKIEFEYFQYLDLKCSVESIKKVIISRTRQ